jgi:hypothetical protein
VATTLRGASVVRRDVTPDTDRREFLRRSAVASLGLAGFAGVAGAQDEPDSARLTRRMAFEEPATLSDDYVRRVILLTDRMEPDPDMPPIAECAFENWPPDELGLWEGLVIEWQNQGFGELLTDNKRVRAEKMVELRIVVDEQDSPVELGTPFIVGGRVECPEGYVGVNANEVPGLRIKTGPGVSTQG